jgi:hypothetical protein
VEVSLSTLRFKLILIWLLCLGLVAATTHTLFWLFLDNSHYSKQQDFDVRANSIAAISLGVSHSRAIHFPSLEISGFSYHDPSSDLQTAAEKYRAIAPLMPNLKYILLPISPPFLHFIQANEIRASRELFLYANYPKYNNFNGKLYWTLLLHYPERMLQKLRFSFRKKFERLTYHFGMSPKQLSCQAKKTDYKGHEDGFIGGYFDTYVDGKCLNELAISTVNGYANQALKTKDLLKNFTKNKNTMAAMVKEIAANQHQLILYIPPFTSEYYEHKSWESVKVEQHQYLQELSLKPNVLFVDYHDLFYHRNYVVLNTLFYDDHHLGLNGAKEFSEIFGRDIRQFESR